MGVSTDMSALVGRERELDFVRTALADARESRGGVLMFTGEPGSGKTSLLSAARALASDFQVVGCAGVEWEAELPFSGLHELLGPLLSHRAALPEPQRVALEGALGLAAVDAPQPLNVYAGALSLVLETTRTRPVLLIVDDLQWIDSTTAQALAFIARRIGGEPIAMLVASRPGTELQGMPVQPVELAPLDQCAVAELAGRHLGRALPEPAAADLAAASGGNPLAVVESARRFGADLWLRGTLLDEPLPVGELIERGFADRLGALTDAAVRALELAAASVNEELATVQAALPHLGLDATALLEAEQASVVTLTNRRVQFAHPLLRALVHRQTSPGRLRECHRSLAAVETSDSNLRAWHAAAAVTGANETIASDLDAAAERFVARGGYLAAAQALARAAELSSHPDGRADRLVRAGKAAYRAGRAAWGSGLLEQAREIAIDPRVRVRATWELTVSNVQVVATDDVAERFLSTARRAEGIDDNLAASAYSSALAEGIMAGRREAAAQAREGLVSLLAGGKISEAVTELAGVSMGLVLVLTGADTAGYGRRELYRAAERRLYSGSSAAVAEGLVWVEAFEAAATLCDQVIQDSRADGDIYNLTGASWADGYRRLRIGDWSGATSSLSEAIALAESSDLPVDLATASATLAVVEACQGTDDRSELVRLRGGEAARFGFPGIVQYTATALGLLALGEGRGAEAAEHFERARAWTNATGQTEPCVLSWPADLVDAYALAGDHATARKRLEEFRERSLVLELPWACANVARLDGLLAADDAYEPHFRRSLDLFAQTQAPFDRARAQLAFGQRLRRSRRKTDAREQLETALAEFDRLGARPWADMARRELGASAPSIRKGPEHDPDALTPQERQVAGLVADGASNKEVAGAMFLSPKTIETHLSRIYRKLGVNSRTQLAARMRG